MGGSTVLIAYHVYAIIFSESEVVRLFFAALSRLFFVPIAKFLNPPTGRYFPLKRLFGTCLKNFFINHSHTAATLFMSVCSQEIGGFKKKFFLEMLH